MAASSSPWKCPVLHAYAFNPTVKHANKGHTEYIVACDHYVNTVVFIFFADSRVMKLKIICILHVKLLQCNLHEGLLGELN